MTKQEALKIGFMEKMAFYGVPYEDAQALYKQAFDMDSIGKFFQEHPEMIMGLLGGGGLGGMLGGTGGGIAGGGLGGLLGYFLPDIMKYFGIDYRGNKAGAGSAPDNEPDVPPADPETMAANTAAETAAAAPQAPATPTAPATPATQPAATPAATPSPAAAAAKPAVAVPPPGNSGAPATPPAQVQTQGRTENNIERLTASNIGGTPKLSPSEQARADFEKTVKEQATPVNQAPESDPMPSQAPTPRAPWSPSGSNVRQEVLQRYNWEVPDRDSALAAANRALDASASRYPPASTPAPESQPAQDSGPGGYSFDDVTQAKHYGAFDNQQAPMPMPPSPPEVSQKPAAQPVQKPQIKPNPLLQKKGPAGGWPSANAPAPNNPGMA
jgi:hypothetical protein